LELSRIRNKKQPRGAQQLPFYVYGYGCNSRTKSDYGFIQYSRLVRAANGRHGVWFEGPANALRYLVSNAVYFREVEG
jgi:hypothetical protein